MKAFFKFIMRTFWFFSKIIWFCFMFLIVYGIIREQIDKLIEKFRQKKKDIQKKKEDTISEMLKTKEGREEFSKTMMDEL